MKIKVSISTDRVGSKCTFKYEIDDEEIEGMCDGEKNRHIDEVVWDEIVNRGVISWGWEDSI